MRPLLDRLRPLRPRVAALWQAREELLRITEAAPLTVTHWDFWPANIYVADADDVVAIDWSQIGIGGVTHDLDQLTLDTVWMLVRPDENLDVLEQHVLPAYGDGLRASGLEVGDDELWRWYAAAAAARYTWLAGGQPDVVGDPEVRRAQEQRFGVDIATITAAKQRVIERAVSLGERVLGG
jgi:aminoglycoside/choline kinase family phosphotransferase